MDCVSPILGFFSSSSSDLLFLLFGNIISLEENIRLLGREMVELQYVRDDVKTEVEDAEKRGLTRTNLVKWWLERVDTLAREAEEIDIQFQRLFRFFGCCHLNVYAMYNLGKIVAGKRAEVLDIKERATFSKIADGQVVGQIEEMPITSPVGMDVMLNRLHEYVTGHEVDIIGIHGMGGAGKTTLLKKFNNDLLCSEHGFDLVIFLEISKDVSVERIQRAIGTRLGFRWQENQDARELSAFILRYLSTKNFVIMLDDIWEPLDLPSVGIPPPNGHVRRKIILSTRIQNICFQMDAQQVMKVECLPFPESWALFALKTRKDFTTCNPLMEMSAKAIATKCGGLPLSITTLGRSMASKETVEEWIHEVMTMADKPWDIQGMKEGVLYRLKLSYDNLADDELKQCFLYCSLFPESFTIDKRRLIDLWLCEGFLGDADYMRRPPVRGHHIIGLLKAASLLEQREDGIGMHPMMRNLALWITSNQGLGMRRWLVHAGLSMSGAPTVERWYEAERISLMAADIDTLPEAPICPHLLTLILGRNTDLRRFHCDFFRHMLSLKVLDLSGTSVEELPASIGEVRELRYLNLSRTDIVSVPRELGQLTKLVQLHLDFICTLKFIPRGVIGSLAPRLQLLGLYGSPIDWELDSSSGDGACFDELQGVQKSCRLAISIGNIPALLRFYNSQNLVSAANCLHVHGCEGLTSILLPSAIGRSVKGLRSLRISDSSELEEVIFGPDEDDERCFLEDLESLEILNLPRARILCRGLLPHQAFADLERLVIADCTAITQLIDGATSAFAGIKELLLVDLPMLSDICSNMALIFPSLQSLTVIRCPRLRKLPLRLSRDNYNLTSIVGQREWWENLEWQDVIVMLSFLLIFKALE